MDSLLDLVLGVIAVVLMVGAVFLERRRRLCVVLLIPSVLLGCHEDPKVSAPPRLVLFFGDSITLHALETAASPEWINWGVGGLGTYFGSRTIDHILRDNPAAGTVAIAFGTNDAYDQRVSVADFERDLGLIVDKILASGRRAILPTIPYSPLPELAGVPAYNAAVTRVIAAKGARAGPDLYAWFLANPGELSADQTHPTPTGYDSINRLWAEALAVSP